MKFIKFLTRKYTLLEHWLIAESLLKKNSSISGIYYERVMDISRNGLVDIHVLKKDAERNRQWVVSSLKKDPRFAEKMLKEGLSKVQKLGEFPLELPKKISKMDDKEIIRELLNLRKNFFDFSGYVDFTIILGDSGIKLKEKNIKRLAEFHEYRKRVFMGYFKFLDKVVKEIAKKKKVKSKDLSFLSFREILYFLEGKMSLEKIDNLYDKRKKYYIAKNFNGKEEIISDNFDEELDKVKNIIIEDTQDIEIKGMAINKGIIKGEVKLITQKTPLGKIPTGKIIVTQMTSPDMTPVLKKAKAIITDEGGLLCHAANIAREFGTVAIIGTKIATKALKDGDFVEVDAEKGVVKVLSRN